MKNHKPHILSALLALVLAILLCACAQSAGDTVERFAQAAPSDGANIAIPGYGKLSFAAGETTQSVDLRNPPQNACTFVLSLTLGEEVLWTGQALNPGEAFTAITLNRALDPGEYPATLHYGCFSLQDSKPLNGAEIQLTIEAE